MKKVFLLAALLTAALVQAAEWRKSFIKGDELVGTRDCYSYVYDSEEGKLALWSNQAKLFLKASKHSHFNTEFSDYSQKYHRSFNVTVGLYNTADVLQSKEVLLFYRDNESYEMAICTDAAKASKIIKYLKNGNGYIRIIAPLYDKKDMNMTIPCSRIITYDVR